MGYFFESSQYPNAVVYGLKVYLRNGTQRISEEDSELTLDTMLALDVKLVGSKIFRWTQVGS